MAIMWLYEEYKMDLMEETDWDRYDDDDYVSSPKRRYTELFYRMLDGIQQGSARIGEQATDMRGLDSKDRVFSRFLVDAPELPPDTVPVIVKSYCDDPERFAFLLFFLRLFFNEFF
jgi:hypothetical protein